MLRMVTGNLVVVVLGAATVLGAQSSSQPANQIAPLPETTLSGCLKAGSTPYTFVLEGAAVRQGATAAVQSASRSTGTSGTSGSSKRNYQLTGIVPPGINLATHANHEVEVVGVIFEPPSGEKKDPKMNMRTFKHIAPKCQ